MGHKPPAFQFYAKDWRSSATVRSMDDHQKAVYIDMIAASWDSEEPGTLPLPLVTCAKVCGRNVRSLRSFLRKFPQTFVKVSGKLVNEKLHDQWLKYKEISEKRSDAANTRHHANAQQEHHSASASSSATSKSKDSAAQTAARPRRFDSRSEASHREAIVGKGPDVPALTPEAWERAFGKKVAR